MNGTYTAVVDRIVDGETAVLLVEEDDNIIEQLNINVNEIPDECVGEGVVCEVYIEDSELVSIDRRDQDTHQRREKMQEKIDRLSNSLSDE